MLSNSQSRRIEFTLEFKRNIRKLSKRYRHIRSDIQPTVDPLAQGETPGDQIPGTNYTVFKTRIKTVTSLKGKVVALG